MAVMIHAHSHSAHLQSKKEIAKALLTKEENYPILVHCIHGKDRIGLLVMFVMLLRHYATGT